MKKLVFTFLLLVGTFSISIYAQIDSAALRQWKSLKYSMFIHWGIYSELGGVWDGKQISRGLSEQIQAHAGIYSDVYAKIATRFNPIKWNPDSIATLAKEAGMGSVILTSKHHDGFSMFNSAVSEFDVVDATPYKRDVVKELAEACSRQGLKFGLYFSLIDWHYPQASPISSHNSDIITPEHHEFNKQQIAELLSNYGPISELWFDMGSYSADQSREMRDLVHKLQPNCMIGSRLGNDMGDFTVMSDNQEPTYIIGVPWQSPASFFDETWGYRSWQKRTNPEEKMSEKLTSLIRVISRGGNYLLNIGPRGDGSVVAYERDILLEIGKWLTKNSEAIYGTDADPFQVSFDWGSVTTKGNNLYLHILKPPARKEIILPGIEGKIVQASVIGSATKIRTIRKGKDIIIALPADTGFFHNIPVIALTFSTAFKVTPGNLIDISKSTTLSSKNSFKYYSNSGIDYNTRFQSTIKEEWNLVSDKNKKISPRLIYSQEEIGKSLAIDIDGNSVNVFLDSLTTLPLENEVSILKKGPIYTNGPLYSGVDGVHGKVENIDPVKPWPRSSGMAWTKTDWLNNSVYILPAGMMTAYYLLQEIEVDKDMRVAITVTRSEGVIVMLNGTEEFIHQDPNKNDSSSNIILLHLKKGKNQLLVKYFNNFSKRIVAGISFTTPQIMYSKTLPVLHMQKGKTYKFYWKNARSGTPHEHLAMPNLSLILND